MSAEETLDCLVVGGGLFGCWLALCLAREHGARVRLVEREAGLLRRASYKNQARVHAGYHYPRSLLTGLRSRVNAARFLDEYGECIERGFEMYYAVGRRRSNVTPEQFARFCRRIGAPLEPAPDRVRALFDPAEVAQVWRAEEHAFDAERLARRLEADLEAAGVDVRRGAEVLRVERAGAGPRGLLAEIAAADGERERARARYVFNCTYSATNELLVRSGVEPLALKQEVAEIALVEAPAELRQVGVTLMCGPFFSFLPFPARGLHSFSHVRYTPHRAWIDADLPWDHPLRRSLSGERSRFEAMRRDALRYLPLAAEFRPRDALFELKTVLPQNEHDDARPILFRRHAELPGLVSVLGAKIDNVYDLERELAALLAAERAA